MAVTSVQMKRIQDVKSMKKPPAMMASKFDPPGVLSIFLLKTDSPVSLFKPFPSQAKLQGIVVLAKNP